MNQGKFIRRARTITLTAVFVAVIISLAFDSGLGTPSSFGIGEFFLLCPLGAIEAFVASRSFLPVTAISLAVVLVFVLLFGRAWCAWGCPAPVIRTFFKRNPHPELHCTPAQAPCASDSTPEGCASGGCAAKALGKGALREGLAHVGRDPRTWVLVAVLVVTFIIGLPIFCLVCPIGLTFGTVGSLWHLIVDKQVTLSAVVFPAALVIELVLYRKWCMNLCPVAGLLSIFGQFARLFRPRIDARTCIESEGRHCSACAHACPEGIDLHAIDAAVALGECTRCGECVKVCPTASVRITAKPSAPVIEASAAQPEKRQS